MDAKPLRIWFNKIDEIIKIYDGIRYLELSNLYNKQILHEFLLNIKNYSHEVINIQRREAELNIVIMRMNNFDIKHKKTWNICFITCLQH